MNHIKAIKSATEEYREKLKKERENMHKFDIKIIYHQVTRKKKEKHVMKIIKKDLRDMP